MTDSAAPVQPHRGRRLGRSSSPVRINALTGVILAVASLAGLAMFLWPLLLSAPAEGQAHSTDAPFIFVLILPLVIGVVLAELSRGGLDVKALAMIGLLAGVGAALRPLGAGIAGIETVFFLLILAGRVYGPGFGFALGSTTLFASAILTGGVGPWLPFQMLGAAWIGLGAGLLPRCRGRREIALLVAYGIFAAYAFGFLLNMWFWPYAIGTAADGYANVTSAMTFVPGDAVVSNLHRFFVFTLATSTFGWDTGRAITNTVAILTIGAPVLAALRRGQRRAAFNPPIEFRPDAPSPPLR